MGQKEGSKVNLKGKRIGIGLTGSFCTYDKIFEQMEKLVEEGADVYPIFSNASQTIDCRFGLAEDFFKRAKEITKKIPITTIEDAEPLGPRGLLDILAIAPCTGNTIGKLSQAITDTPVLMAAKGHLRNNKPLVISLSSNDALSMNFKNIGALFNAKNYYFVPFGQDNFNLKPHSMIAHTELLIPTLELALQMQQIQPVILGPLS